MTTSIATEVLCVRLQALAGVNAAFETEGLLRSNRAEIGRIEDTTCYA